MPVTLQPTSMKYKKRGGNFVSVDCIKGDPGSVDDVIVNEESIVDANGVADIPLADKSNYGLVMLGSNLFVGTGGKTYVENANSATTKAGTSTTYPIVPGRQHEAVFYGLAKLAGEDMSSSSNPVGTFTDNAKSAIRTMFGIGASLPAVTSSDNGSVLMVVNGAWAAATIPAASGVSF